MLLPLYGSLGPLGVKRGGARALLHDTFSGTNGTNLIGRLPDMAGSSGWASRNGSTADIQSNRGRLTNEPGAEPYALIVNDAVQANYSARYVFRLGTYARFPVRVGSSDNTHYSFDVSPGSATLTLYEWGGSFVARGTAAITAPSAGVDYTMTIVANGNSIAATFGGVTLTYNSATRNSSSTLLGLSGGFCQFDELEVSPI